MLVFGADARARASEQRATATHTQHSTQALCYTHNHRTALSVLGHGPKAVSVISTENLVRGALLNPGPDLLPLHPRTICVSTLPASCSARAYPELACAACCYSCCIHFPKHRILHAAPGHILGAQPRALLPRECLTVHPAAGQRATRPRQRQRAPWLNRDGTSSPHEPKAVPASGCS